MSASRIRRASVFGWRRLALFAAVPAVLSLWCSNAVAVVVLASAPAGPLR